MAPNRAQTGPGPKRAHATWAKMATPKRLRAVVRNENSNSS